MGKELILIRAPNVIFSSILIWYSIGCPLCPPQRRTHESASKRSKKKMKREGCEHFLVCCTFSVYPAIERRTLSTIRFSSFWVWALGFVFFDLFLGAMFIMTSLDLTLPGKLAFRVKKGREKKDRVWRKAHWRLLFLLLINHFISSSTTFLPLSPSHRSFSRYLFSLLGGCSSNPINRIAGGMSKHRLV